DHVVAAPAQPIDEERDLGALPRSVTALEHHEPAPQSRRHPVAESGVVWRGASGAGDLVAASGAASAGAAPVAGVVAVAGAARAWRIDHRANHPAQSVIRPPPHNAIRTPGNAYWAPPRVTVCPVPTTTPVTQSQKSDQSGEITSEISRH